MSASDEAAASILRLRSEVVAKLLGTDLGQELARLDAAYSVLVGKPPPPWYEEVATDKERPSDNGMTKVSREAVRRRLAKRTSVKSQLKGLIDEQPRRWDYESALAELENRGDPVKAANPRNSLRTAVWQLVQTGDAERSPEGGTFWSTLYSELSNDGLFSSSKSEAQ